MIRDARKEKHVTQRELAKMINIDFSYISKIETNALGPPSEAVINKIAKTLEIEPNELFISAKKVPTEFTNCIFKEDTIANILFRRYQYLTKEQKERIKKIIEES